MSLQRLIDWVWMRRMFPARDLERISQSVARAELETSGEIRVVIRVRRDAGVNSIQSQAERDFIKHGLQNTRDKTGVLLLVVLQDHQFWIMGDEGVNNLLGTDFWTRQALYLSSAFISRQSTEGICQVVMTIGKRLSESFPPRADDQDELSNQPVVEV